MLLHVANIDFEVDEQSLKAFFEIYGKVSSISIVADRFSGLSKGFGFVEMPDNAEALLAMKHLNGKQILERKIEVSQAENQS